MDTTMKDGMAWLDEYLLTSFASKDKIMISVADPDPGSGAFLTPGSGIPIRVFPDPKPIPTFES
jgi:hypothetical protein